MKKYWKYIIAGAIALFLLLGVILVLYLPKHCEEKERADTMLALWNTKFDEFFETDEERFVNMTFQQVMLEYELIFNKLYTFDVVYTYNEKIPQYDQIIESYDTENNNFVCAHLQIKEKNENDNWVVTSAVNAIFEISKSKKEVKPIGIATKDKNYKLTHTEDPAQMIRYLYNYIELMMKYCDELD